MHIGNVLSALAFFTAATHAAPTIEERASVTIDRAAIEAFTNHLNQVRSLFQSNYNQIMAELQPLLPDFQGSVSVFSYTTEMQSGMNQLNEGLTGLAAAVRDIETSLADVDRSP